MGDFYDKVGMTFIAFGTFAAVPFAINSEAECPASLVCNQPMSEPAHGSHNEPSPWHPGTVLLAQGTTATTAFSTITTLSGLPYR
jgi:hypothetical protein